MTIITMMRNRIFSIWNQLADEKHIGLSKRLYSDTLSYHIYCVYQYPENLYGIALSFQNTINPSIRTFDRLNELKVALYEDSSFENCNLLVVQLEDSGAINEFGYLCENVIESISFTPNIKKAVQAFVNSLERWKKLFEKKTADGLSKEEQQGLYGELTYLEKLIRKYKTSNVVQYWVGSDRALRDFQGDNWAVEVKTSSTNNPQSININGERQLDDSMIGYLFLFHLSLEKSNLSGETLPQKINVLRDLLKCNLSELNLFNAKLFEAGYFDFQSKLYANTCYKLRKEQYYEVKGKFPRICESELRDGVGDVHYKISISTCDEFLVSENKVTDKVIADD